MLHQIRSTMSPYSYPWPHLLCSLNSNFPFEGERRHLMWRTRRYNFQRPTSHLKLNTHGIL
jgi:hypothetical protein